MSVRDGLLALLAAGPKHGYQLKSELESATGEAWSVNVGQVYTTLGRLERDGLVSGDEPDDEGRQVFTITDAGRRETLQWFATAVERPVGTRDEVTLKVLLAVATRAADARSVIATQRAASMATLQDFVALRLRSAPGEVAWLLHLDRLILATEAELQWLERAEARLDDVGPPPAAVQDTSQNAAEVDEENSNV